MAKKIFIGNYKGGVGKTTFAYNMGCILRKRKKRVLMIDLDPQSSLSEICYNAINDDEAFSKLPDDETLNHVIDIYYKAGEEGIYEELNFDIDKLIKDNKKVKFIPSSYLYKDGGLDIQCLNMQRKVNDVMMMKRFIEHSKLEEKFDYIIFDCPPSNNIITLAAFLVSDYYIIPTIMDSISTNGISHYKELLDKFYKKYLNGKDDVVNATFGKQPTLLGVFEYRKKKQVNTDKFRQKISGKYHLFDTVIYDYKEISDSLEAGNESSKEEFAKLVDEIEERIIWIEGNINEKSYW